MNEITCRGCGKPESECTCNIPTIDKDTQIIELQERIKELEALILTEEEAISLAIYVSDEIARLNRQASFLRESVEAGARIGNAYTKCSMSINDNERLLAKLQAIIEGDR